MEELDVMVVHEVLNSFGRSPSVPLAKNSMRRRQSRIRVPRRTLDYFNTLSKATEEANRNLIRNKSKFRFCVYRKGERVFVDVAELDSAGRNRSFDTREITDEEFDRCIEDLANAQGLCIDQSA